MKNITLKTNFRILMSNVEKIKKIIGKLSVAALEEDTKIAGVAVISKSGKVVYQTENFDLTNQENIILNVLNGESSFRLSNYRYTVTETFSEGIIAENDGGMGYNNSSFSRGIPRSLFLIRFKYTTILII
jgi:hypothetical protein